MFRKNPRTLADFFSADYVDLADYKLDNAQVLLDFHFRQELKEFIELYDIKSWPFDRVKQMAEDFLAKRWQKINGKPAAYLNVPDLPSTQFCLRLAEKLSECCTPDEKGVNCLKYLMPTLPNVQQMHPSVSLAEMLLTDDGNAVSIDECLRASRAQKRFCYLNSTTHQFVKLTDQERERLKNHSAETAAYYFAVEFYLEDCRIDSALEALSNGLSKHNSVGRETQDQQKVAIANFELFLEELKKIPHGPNSTKYNELMKKGHHRKLSEIWDLLRWNQLSYAVCADALTEILIYLKNADFLLECHPALSAWAEARIDVAQKAYCNAVKEERLHVTSNRKVIECVKSFNNDELKQLFTHTATDTCLIIVWRHLAIEQKNQLIGILERERLSKILRPQGPCNELQSAIRSLEHEITVTGGAENNALADQVLRGIRKDRSKAKSNDELLMLAIIAHRTAVGVREPFNIMNLRSYAETVNAFSNQSKQPRRSTIAAMSFSSLLLYGVMSTLIVLATHGIGLVGLTIAGAVLSGLGGTKFGCNAIHAWKRPPFHRTTVAAMHFLKDRECKTGEKFITSKKVEVKVEENVDPEKLQPEAQIKLGY